jgi:hypothetical protein
MLHSTVLCVQATVSAPCKSVHVSGIEPHGISPLMASSRQPRAYDIQFSGRILRDVVAISSAGGGWPEAR